MFRSAVYITVRSGPGAVKIVKGEDPVAMKDDD